MSYFYCEEHLKRSVMDGHNAISEEMRGEVGRSISSNGRTIKETDSDWQLGRAMGTTIFL